MDPESAHRLAMKCLGLVSKVPFILRLLTGVSTTRKHQPIRLAGMTFQNRVGLAAGFDKNGSYLSALQHLPFGHIEVGTVTPKSQPGNPRPRLFRLPEDNALINRMGFNNLGVEHLVQNLIHFKKTHEIIIGGNIGKNKDTSVEETVDDYVYCFERLFDHVDYFSINISSPNTPGLRDLQAHEPLDLLLGTIQLANSLHDSPKPIFLKIAPDISSDMVEDIAQLAIQHQLSGIIASNTTIRRAPLKSEASTIDRIGAGGLSGEPLKERSTQLIRSLRQYLPRPFVIIGVGGVSSASDAIEKIEAGADLIQVYTGFIYKGPQLIEELSHLD